MSTLRWILTLISLLVLIIMISLWASYFPKILIALSLASFAVYILFNVEHIAYILLIVGSFFDETHISLGFALLGGGDLGIFAFIPVWLIRRWSTRKSTHLNLPAAWHLLLMYYAMVTMSLLLGETPQLAYGQYIRHGIYILTFFALVDELSQHKKLLIAVYTFVLCSSTHAIAAQIIENPNARYEGLVDQSNLLGFLIGMGLILAISMMHMRIKYRFKVILVVLISICFMSLILTISRGSYIALMMALLFYYRKRWRVLLFWIALIATVMMILYVVDIDRFLYILRRLQFRDQSVSNRQAVLMNSLKMIQEYPFFGIGFGQFTFVSEVLQIELEAGRGSHNFYLGLCASVGLIAAYYIFSFVLWQGKGLWQSVQHMQSHLIPSEYNRLILFQSLQSLMVFHSVSLIFRGNKRMIEWIPLALYAAASLYHYNDKMMKHSVNTHRQNHKDKRPQTR
jgi:O-antigen ligase